jgi:hypothetical protein
VGEGVSGALLADDLQLVLGGRVAERGFHEEAVELRLGERKRALVLDRVLGREQEERLGQESRLAVDRHLALGHRLEQGGLRLRHRAVDLVDEQDVREDRARPELEVALLLVVDREACDVGRLQVGRALHAGELEPGDRLRDRARENGLRRARDVFEEDMPLAGERREYELDLVRLAVDDRLDVRAQPLGDLNRPGEPVDVRRATHWVPLYRRFATGHC